MTARIDTQLRWSPELHDRITAEAHARGLTVQWFVTKLIEEGLDRLKPAGEFSLTRTRPTPDDEPWRQARGAIRGTEPAEDVIRRLRDGSET